MKLLQQYFWFLAVFLLPVLYLVTTIVFYLIFYKWKKKEFENCKIQASPVPSKQLNKEILYGIVSLAIFCITGFCVHLLQSNGYSQVYFEPLKHGVWYLFVSVVLMIFFHDMYFYWTHRLLHMDGWYQKIHRVHHISSNPSPFTALSFHPVEAFIQALVLPVMVIIIPAHPFSLFVFLCFMVYKNVKGHAGYEFTSRASRINKWNALYNFPLHHNLHHHYGRDNYGLYFTIWDKMMNTFRKEP